jgi:hypothetical protein
MSQTQVKKRPWWEKKWKDKVCPITQTRIRPGKNKKGISYTTVLSCSHAFSTSAIESWAVRRTTCPMCRKPFTFEEVERIDVK